MGKIHRGHGTPDMKIGVNESNEPEEFEVVPSRQKLAMKWVGEPPAFSLQ
jgi:hypothetical protein